MRTQKSLLTIFCFHFVLLFQQRSHGYQRTHKRAKHLIRDMEKMWGRSLCVQSYATQRPILIFFSIYKNKIDT